VERRDLASASKVAETISVRQDVHLHSGGDEILDDGVTPCAVAEAEAVNQEEAGE
jgi:hypothetical protein